MNLEEQMMEGPGDVAESMALRACERLCLDYAHLADVGLMDAWVQLFAQDAELTFSGQTHAGRAAIQEAAGDGVTLHVITNIRIDRISTDEAEGSAYATLYTKPSRSEPTGVTPAFVGVYRDRFVRTPDGWLFSKRAFETFGQATG